MKKNIVFLLLMFISILACTNSNQKEAGNEEIISPHLATRVLKGACLFAGQIEKFTEQDWKALGESTVTDFVIIPKTAEEYNASSEGYQSLLTPFMVETIQNLVRSNPKVKCWIGTPGITSLNFEIADENIDPFYEYIQSVKKALSHQLWDRNIAGVYMNQEALYGPIDIPNITENQCYKLISNLSDKIHFQLKKQFLWIPYYGFGPYADLVNTGLAYVSNQTDIFDYVVIQPHHYFEGNAPHNITAVKHSVARQSVSTPDGKSIFPKESKTAIGAEMEMSWRIVPPNNYAEFKERFQQYLDAFSEYEGQYPIIFYWDGDLKKAFESKISPFFSKTN